VSRLDTVKKIVSASRTYSREEGENIVTVLLSGRTVNDLSHAELLSLAQGYNWWGKGYEAYQAFRLAFKQRPTDPQLMSQAGTYFGNYIIENTSSKKSYLEVLLESCEVWEKEGLGTSAFWSVWKARVYSMYATGEMDEEDYEWYPGHPIRHLEMLDLAAKELEKVLKSDPLLLQSEKDKMWTDPWNEMFVAVLSVPQYRHLASKP